MLKKKEERKGKTSLSFMSFHCAIVAHAHIIYEKKENLPECPVTGLYASSCIPTAELMLINKGSAGTCPLWLHSPCPHCYEDAVHVTSEAFQIFQISRQCML